MLRHGVDNHPLKIFGVGDRFCEILLQNVRLSLDPPAEGVFFSLDTPGPPWLKLKSLEEALLGEEEVGSHPTVLFHSSSTFYETKGQQTVDGPFQYNLLDRFFQLTRPLQTITLYPLPFSQGSTSLMLDTLDRVEDQAVQYLVSTTYRKRTASEVLSYSQMAQCLGEQHSPHLWQDWALLYRAQEVQGSEELLHRIANSLHLRVRNWIKERDLLRDRMRDDLLLCEWGGPGF